LKGVSLCLMQPEPLPPPAGGKVAFVKVVALDHLVLTVQDLDATVDFYTAVLGMAVRAFEGGRLALRFGSQKINLHQAGHEFKPNARRALPGSGDLCFVVDGTLDDWLEHLAGKGVEVIEGPVHRTGALGPVSSIYFRDPDGNLVELASYS
jgi:catechol 2,3-dioxygenase-like lactoylglutathione lyase family enzyme